MRRERLIQARKSSGRNQEQIAEVVGVDRTTLGKWERGESTPHPNQRATYARALGVTLQELDAMLYGAPKGGPDEMPDWLSTYLGMEQSAIEIDTHEPRAVHGLLQTPDYARELVRRIGLGGSSETYVRTAVEQRVNRQKRVRNGDLKLVVIQPESSLHLVVGDAATMAAQLDAVVELSRLPNVSVLVTTYDVGQYEARRVGPISIMTHPWGKPRVYIETWKGAEDTTDDDEVKYFRGAFEQASRLALPPEKSRNFIARLAEEWSARL
ncbi:Scr1 family TA system antitoxin-like transcriptional regulator [Nocardia sp. NPDC004068]|uniref:helix-turn-helix domain-containing protein n=1 Tax=Nocardia sp. NPDC004068 TaxID=3364303 RepID=UPI0036A0930F